MESRNRRAFALLVLSLLLLPLASWAEGQQAPSFEGRWAGVVIFQFAETEVDLIFQFDRRPDGTWGGTLTSPIQGMKDRALQKVEVNGSDIAFVKGPTETFVGKLSADGSMITGEFTQDGESYPFELERRTGPDPVPALQPLAADSSELKRRFNADHGKVRLLLLMSPTCGCRIAARVVQRHVLEQIEDDRLRVYVVWEPIKKNDDRNAAVESTALMTDPRVTHFWTDSLQLAEALKAPIALEKSPAWDVFLLFAPDARWEDAVPKPSSFLHQLGDALPADRKFDGIKLAGEVYALLARQDGKVSTQRP
ncbi:MAG: hypothetical protein QOH06_3657 [Acidobacteriota bacterium]|jgi:hypothetical protein|nr:hypothetical protein [Acidobacteriota bacterium]